MLLLILAVAKNEEVKETPRRVINLDIFSWDKKY